MFGNYLLYLPPLEVRSASEGQSRVCFWEMLYNPCSSHYSYNLQASFECLLWTLAILGIPLRRIPHHSFGDSASATLAALIGLAYRKIEAILYLIDGESNAFLQILELNHWQCNKISMCGYVRTWDTRKTGQLFMRIQLMMMMMNWWIWMMRWYVLNCHVFTMNNCLQNRSRNRPDGETIFWLLQTVSLKLACHQVPYSHSIYVFLRDYRSDSYVSRHL